MQFLDLNAQAFWSLRSIISAWYITQVNSLSFSSVTCWPVFFIRDCILLKQSIRSARSISSWGAASGILAIKLWTSCFPKVIPPAIVVLRNRKSYAACSSFCIGVNPSFPMLGPSFKINKRGPKPPFESPSAVRRQKSENLKVLGNANAVDNAPKIRKVPDAISRT